MHYIFIIHGSGDYQPGWMTSHEAFLYQKAAQHTGKSEQECRDSFTFVEVNYQNILDNQLDGLINGGQSLGKFNEWLIKIAEKRADRTALDAPDLNIGQKLAALNSGFLLDSLIYTRSPEIVNHIMLAVSEQILSVYAESPNLSSYSFIGHGLGTKVLFDFLHRLYWADNAPSLPHTPSRSRQPFSVTASGRPSHHSMSVSSLYLLANAAPLLNLLDHTAYTMNNSHVRIFNDSSFPVQQGIVRSAYRIFNNKMDPIAQLGRTKSISQKVYTEAVELTYSTQLWMHNMSAYLRHPRVYLSLIEDVFKTEINDKMQIAAAYDEEHKPGSMAKGVSLDFINRIRAEAEREDFTARDIFITFMKNLSDNFITI